MEVRDGAWWTGTGAAPPHSSQDRCTGGSRSGGPLLTAGVRKEGTAPVSPSSSKTCRRDINHAAWTCLKGSSEQGILSDTTPAMRLAARSPTYPEVPLVGHGLNHILHVRMEGKEFNLPRQVKKQVVICRGHVGISIA